MYNSVLGIRAAGGLVWELDAGSALSGGGTELSHHIKVCWRLHCQISFLILCMDGRSQLNTAEMENVKSEYLLLQSFGIRCVLYLHRRDKGIWL